MISSKRSYTVICLAVCQMVLNIWSPLFALAAAPGYNRDLDYTYYSNEYRGGWYLFLATADLPYDGITADWETSSMTVDKFVEGMRVRLYSVSDINRSRASAVINMMMNVDGDSPLYDGPSAIRWQNGVALAQANFAQWELVVRQYDAAGKVNFNTFYNASNPADWLGATADATQWGAGSTPAPDVKREQLIEDFVNEQAIVFYNDDGSQFTILKKCVNLIGDIRGLTVPSYTVDVGLGPAQTVQPGQTFTLQVTAHNTSATEPVPNGIMEVYRVPGITNVPCPPGNCLLSAPAQTDLDDGGYKVSSVHGFRPNSSIAGESGQNWYWTTNPLPGASNVSGSFQVTIASGASPGPFTMKVCFTPGDELGGKTCSFLNLTVASVRTPTLVGENGDIHAGGHVAVNGVCTQLGSAADVRANPGSYGDYLISASGTISASPNSNGSGGATTLKLGSDGGYAEICRPDLLAAANAYTGPVNIINNPATFSVTGKGGVWRYTGGGTLYISGVIDQSITIVSTSGNVVFDSNVVINPALNLQARSMPSLGVIAQGNILISSGVTQLDAYLFSSNGTINTCYQANSSCSNALVVNGFLMASDIIFGRLGPLNTSGAQLAERISLTPQLYLNPPMFFNGIATNVSLDGQGEKQPLF